MMRNRFRTRHYRFFRIFLLAAATLTASAQTEMFRPFSSTTVDDQVGSPVSVATADVNGDRLPDVLIASTVGVHVLTAVGGGRFELSQSILSGHFLRVTTADFNRDGFVDIAAAAQSSSTTVLLGDGRGQFRKSSELLGRSYDAADLNGDGIMDLALLFEEAISISFGVGDGTFRSGPRFSTRDPSSLVLTDLNRDGRVDVVVGPRFSDSMAVLMGTVGGGFRFLENPPQCSYARSLAVVDFNRDGIPDVVCANQGITILAGKGDGSFSRHSETKDPDLVLTVATGDFNGDGLPDLAAGHYYNGYVSIMLGSADGTFAPVARVSSLGDVSQVVTSDINGDAKPDLVLASFSAASVVAAFGSGDAQFSGPIAFGWSGKVPLHVADLNGDGTEDFAVALPYRQTIVTVDGSSGRRRLVFASGYPLDVALMDVNADRIPDLVAVTASQIATGRESLDSSHELAVLLGRGDGGFEAPIPTAIGKSMTGDIYTLPLALAVGDFTGSGAIGAVVANNSTGTLDLYRGSGTGTFTRVASFAASNVLRMMAVDLNSDGIQDVAMLRSDGEVDIFSGSAAGLNLLGSYPGVCRAITAGVAGDINEDRKPDLIVACDDGRVQLLTNSGTGTFRDRATVVAGFRPGAVALSDFDGDGKADIIAVSVYKGSEEDGGIGRLLLGKGDGTFRESAVVRWPRLLELQPVLPSGNSRSRLVLLENIADNTSSSRQTGKLQITLFRNTIPNTPPGRLDIVSAASFKPGRIARRSIVALFGDGLSSSTEAASSTALPTMLGETSVILTDVNGQDWPVSLFFVSPRQINALIPAVPWGSYLPSGEFPWSSSTITVISNGRTVAQGIINAGRVSLALFTANADGKGVPAAQVLRVKADGTRSIEPVYRCAQGPGSCVPMAIEVGNAAEQVFLTLYGTGLGECGAWGVNVLIGGVAAPVQSAGPQGQFPGLDQINVLLPPSLTGKGESDLSLKACDVDANPVRVNMR